MRASALVLLATAGLSASACSRQVQVGGSSARVDRITSAEQLLTAMHDRYVGTWYRNMTFTQKTTYYRADGSVNRSETWHEAGAFPGRLRIDFGDLARGNGALYRGDSLYSVQDGKVVARQTSRNLLLVLGFDVYAQPASRTIEQLRAEHIDVTKFREETLGGRRMYVVGAAAGDSTSNQFWVEADRLLFVRLMQTDARSNTTQDIRFEKYVPHGGGWVAEEVRLTIGGKLRFHEEYSNVQVNVALDENLFVPERWKTATHWLKQ
jgi:hypothetical protein